MNNCEYQDLTGKIIACFYKVYNILGYGFLEKVYENALYHELNKSGMSVKQQVPIKLVYDKCIVGDYLCDLCVNDNVIIEVKSIQAVKKEHEAQLLNYLKVTEVEVGLLLNFGLKPEVKRRAFSNTR